MRYTRGTLEVHYKIDLLTLVLLNNSFRGTEVHHLKNIFYHVSDSCRIYIVGIQVFPDPRSMFPDPCKMLHVPCIMKKYPGTAEKVNKFNNL
jgi:hypothetical protein